MNTARRFGQLAFAALLTLAVPAAHAGLGDKLKDGVKEAGKKLGDGVDKVKGAGKKAKDAMSDAGKKIRAILESGGEKASDYCYQCDRDVYEARATDGCSNPLKDEVTQKGKKVFRKACDNHDVCYALPGTTQLHCDKNFLRDMKRLCDDLSFKDGFKYVCHTAALTWYAAVRAEGGGAFEGGQKWAKKNCSMKKARKCPAGFKRVP